MPLPPPLRVALLLVLVAGLAATAPAGAAKSRAGTDLGVTRLGDPPARLAAGASLRVPFAVRNAGPRRAGASTIGFSLSLDARRDAADVPLGKAKVAALARRRSARGTARLRLPAHVQPGTYRVLACADLAGRVRERNERNNCRLARASLTVSAGDSPGGPPVRPGPETGQLPPPPTGPGTGPGQPGTPGGPDPIPPDPAAVAPPLPETTAVSTFDAASFLFNAAAPIQRGVDAGTISRDRIAVLRGRVHDRAGPPIEGVRVTVLDHPELGTTNTRADGEFDLAVNGAGVTLSFEVAGFLPVSARSTPTWQDYDRSTDIVMVPVDAAVTRIEDDSDRAVPGRAGTQSDDKDGERRARCCSRRDPSASMSCRTARRSRSTT